MTLVNTSSLAATVDAVSEALFLGDKMAAKERQTAARFIAARQGQPGCYGGLFAPLPGDQPRRLTLFTGETIINTQAGSAHILGQEAYRALLLLDVRERGVQAAADAAAAAMGPRLREQHSRGWY